MALVLWVNLGKESDRVEKESGGRSEKRREESRLRYNRKHEKLINAGLYYM